MSIRRPLAVLLVAFCTTGCLHRSHDVADAFTWNDALPAGATLHLRDLNGTIRVRPAPAADARATVLASKHWRRGREKDVHFAANRVGNDVYVCALWGKANQCDASGYGEAPTSLFRRFLGLFSMERSTGDMRVDFEVTVPAGVHVDASTVNGDVDASANGAPVRAATVHGNVHASGVAPLVGHSVSGDVSLILDSLGATDSIAAASVKGDVSATVPADFQGNVNLSTVKGSVASDLPVAATQTDGSHTELKGEIGSAPRAIKLHTVSGSAHVIKRG